VDFAATNPGRSAGQRAAASTKIVVAGGFGVGKTTLVGSVSEIVPLRTEALVTNESEGVDDLAAVPTKSTTTVAMDFGRLTLAEDLVLYLFGTPGQRRFWFMWDDLCRGAIGAIVMVDTNRLDESFSPLDYFESKKIPFIVAVNQFEGTQTYELDDIRTALAIRAEVPMIRIDARNRESAKYALLRVTEYALEQLRANQPLKVN
jgi:signal recognition particle receptor subunit beta